MTLQALAAVMVMLLALPQGWCCMLPRMLPKAKDAEASCCCCQAKQAPAPEQKDDSQEPTDPFTCCCEPREMSVDQGIVWTHTFDMPFAILATFDEILPTSPSVAFDSPQQGDSNGPPLHVLHCVWRC